MTKSKFPKAFAAVGLATVLVGCGGGSQNVTETPAPMADGTEIPTPGETETPMADGTETPMAEAKAAVENALATSESRIDALGNYSTDEQFSVAEDGLDNILKLLAEDTNISVADKEAFDEKYLQLRAEFNNRVEMKGNLMTKNDEATKFITATSKWDNDIMSTIDLNLNQTGITSPMYSDVINSDKMDGSTRITYRSTSITSAAFADVLERGTMIEDLPEGWEGKSFMPHTDRQEHLKIFTDRMEPSETYAGKWEDFWGATNNSTNASGTATIIRAVIPVTTATVTSAMSTGTDGNAPAPSKYFEEGYYSHAFKESNVDILRGATAMTVEEFNNDADAAAEEPKEIVRIWEGESSAIHYTDLNTEVGQMLMNEPLLIGTNDTTLPSFVTLFERPVTLGCTVRSLSSADTPNTAVSSNGGGCKVSLNLEGFLMVEHIKLSVDGDTDDTDNEDSPITDKIIEDNIARLTLTTTEKRSDLKDKEIDLERPDTDYKVMGYWIDKNGDEYTIDTFATARYGPAGETGITGNIGRLEGEATYTGDSFGAYVMNKGDGDNMDLYDGEFKATVTLNANFMDPNRRSNANAFTVYGMIENFESLTRTEDNLAAWTLDLNMSTVNNSTGSFSGTTTGEGNWQGQFYGRDGMDTADEEGDDLPLAAVGDFSGNFGNSNRVVGVFGADKVVEE